MSLFLSIRDTNNIYENCIRFFPIEIIGYESLKDVLQTEMSNSLSLSSM